jgi:ketosteroid isomerase-like protein
MRDDATRPADLAARLEAVEHRLDRIDSERSITRLMYRYIYACDELKDAAAIAECFTEDAVWEGRGNFDEFGATVGRAAIHEMFVENPKMLPFTAHFLTNPVVGLSQDGLKGWGQWHTLEAATLRDGAAQVWMLAWYDNDFRRVGDDWKISHIRFTDRVVCPYDEGWLRTRYVSPLTLTKHTTL